MDEDPFLNHRTWHLNRVHSKHRGGYQPRWAGYIALACVTVIIGIVALAITRAA